jgi:hypothetical protein
MLMMYVLTMYVLTTSVLTTYVHTACILTAYMHTKYITHGGTSVADPDPGSGTFLPPGSGIRDPE